MVDQNEYSLEHPRHEPSGNSNSGFDENSTLEHPEATPESLIWQEQLSKLRPNELRHLSSVFYTFVIDLSRELEAHNRSWQESFSSPDLIPAESYARFLTSSPLQATELEQEALVRLMDTAAKEMGKKALTRYDKISERLEQDGWTQDETYKPLVESWGETISAARTVAESGLGAPIKYHRRILERESKNYQMPNFRSIRPWLKRP